MIVIGPSTNVNMGNVNRSMGAGGSLVGVGAGAFVVTSSRWALFYSTVCVHTKVMALG